jgi:hypothetical protein
MEFITDPDTWEIIFKITVVLLLNSIVDKLSILIKKG